MEIYLEILKELLKGIVRETGAFIFRKKVLENKKTTQRAVASKKGGSQKE